MSSPEAGSSSTLDDPAKKKILRSHDGRKKKKIRKTTSGSGDSDSSTTDDSSATVSPLPEPTFSPELLNFMRLGAIHIEVVTNVFHFVFEKGSKGRKPGETLLDFYRRKGVDMKQFEDSRSCMCGFKHTYYVNATQLKMMKDDPEGKTFDITLLYHCIRNGKYKFAKGKDNNKWMGTGGASPESSLTKLKEKRNKQAHANREHVYSYSKEKLADETKELHEHLTRILECAESLYSIAPEIVKEKVIDMNAKIDELVDADLKKMFEKYKEDSLFAKLGEIVNHDGKNEVIKQYKFGEYTDAAPVTHLQPKKGKEGKQIPVIEIYTDMELKNQAEDESKIIQYHQILQDKSNLKPIILIEGIAGVGKTTLLKKILHDWMINEGTMEDLKKYDLLLYAECRNSAIRSFKDLLAHLMPETLSKNLKNLDDMKYVVLDQKLLVILDGLDEVNASSTDLFKELIELNKKFRITVVVTTRPEKLPFFEANTRNLNKKHIKLLGLAKEKRHEFVWRYYQNLIEDANEADIDGIINYLRRNADRLAELWKIPYNLAFLTILWVNDNKSLSNIETASQLYKEINKLYRTKLKERLLSCKNTQALQDSEIDTIIDSFLYSLAIESLLGLDNDNIVCITHEAYQRLNNVCGQIDVPIEEMIGAFLIKVFPSSREAYRFPHKGFQEYQAAQCIRMQLTGGYQSSNVKKVIDNVDNALIDTSLSVPEKKCILKYTEEVLKGKLRHKTIVSILNEIHKPSSPEIELSKFQNVFIQLIGMFYLEENKIPDDVKLEALELLEQSGVNDPDQWLNIMNEVKCDEFVTSFICRQPGILEGEITITDAFLFAYTSIMKTLEPNLENPRNVMIEVDIKGDISDSKDFLQQINKHQFQVTRILITGANYIQYTSMLKSLSSPLRDPHEVNIEIKFRDEVPDLTELVEVISNHQFNVVKIDLHSDFRQRSPDRHLENDLNQIFRRCQVEMYVGRLTPGLVLPFTLRRLRVSIAEDDSYQRLQEYIHSPQQHLEDDGLHLCVRHNVDWKQLGPLPDWSSLYILGIQDVENAINMAQQLNPTTGDYKKFSFIAFPSLSPSVPVEEILRRIKEKKGGIRVGYGGVVFPSSSCRKGSEERLKQLARDAGVTLLWGQIPGYEENIDDW